MQTEDEKKMEQLCNLTCRWKKIKQIYKHATREDEKNKWKTDYKYAIPSEQGKKIKPQIYKHATQSEEEKNGTIRSTINLTRRWKKIEQMYKYATPEDEKRMKNKL